MRLIDADALKAVFEEKSSVAVCGVELCKAIISRIDEAPTIDAVPVVRCCDCKHWDGVDTCDVIDAPVWDDDFCSLAEREEECGQRSVD